MFEIILSNGDTAEADSAEGAVLAAREMFDDLGRAGIETRQTTAAIYANGKLVREKIRRNDLWMELLR